MRTRRYLVPFRTHRLERFWAPVKNASSPTPETGVLAPLFAPSNILLLGIDTVMVMFDLPVEVQLHPVVAIGAPAVTLTPTALLT